MLRRVFSFMSTNDHFFPKNSSKNAFETPSKCVFYKIYEFGALTKASVKANMYIVHVCFDIVHCTSV